MFEQWLHIAERDLKAAKILHEAGQYEVAAYQCQQCAEKALKAVLAFYEQPLRKTHDLGVLLRNVIDSMDDSFLTLTEACDALNGLDTEYRYPDEDAPSLPTEEESAKFLDDACLIFDFVSEKLNS